MGVQTNIVQMLNLPKAVAHVLKKPLILPNVPDFVMQGILRRASNDGAKKGSAVIY